MSHRQARGYAAVALVSIITAALIEQHPGAATVILIPLALYTYLLTTKEGGR